MSLVPLVPPESLAMMRDETSRQLLESEVDWYAAGDQPNLHGVYEYEGPTTLQARVLQKNEQLYNQQGEQVVSTQVIYLLYGVPVGPNDKLVGVGENPSRWPPILEIQQVPTIGGPVFLRIRTGQA
jgi:hypothetical protein